MNLTFKKATDKDVKLIICLLNQSFISDYIKYGQCPAYNRSDESVLKSIHERIAYIVYADDTPIGTVIVNNKKDGTIYIGSLCVIPQFEHKGYGQKILDFVFNNYKQAEKFELKTPQDKYRNVDFYRKIGFEITSEAMDGNVKVYNFTYNNKRKN